MLRVGVLLLGLLLSGGLVAVFGWIALVACFGLALLTLAFSTGGPIEPGAADEMGTAPAAL